jgi:hypothetical protein
MQHVGSYTNLVASLYLVGTRRNTPSRGTQGRPYALVRLVGHHKTCDSSVACSLLCTEVDHDGQLRENEGPWVLVAPHIVTNVAQELPLIPHYERMVYSGVRNVLLDSKQLERRHCA